MPKSKKFPRWIWLVIAIIIIGGILIWVMKNRSVPNMDELGRDNLYHYRNEELGFSLDLPPEFIYYQVERFNAADYTEIRFFVPTSDPNYVYEVVPSYAKPIVIRVYSEAAFPIASYKTDLVGFDKYNNQFTFNIGASFNL